jgi:hypothetical protein
VGFGVIGRFLNIINRLNNNFNKFIMANKVMVEICSEPGCGGRLIPQLNGILICEKCGIEDEFSSINAPHLTNLFKKSYAGGDNSKVPHGKKAKEYNIKKSAIEKRKLRQLNKVLAEIDLLLEGFEIEKDTLLEPLREIMRNPFLKKSLQGISRRHFGLSILISLLVGYYYESLKRGKIDLSRKIEHALYLVESTLEDDCEKASRILSKAVELNCEKLNNLQDVVYFRASANPLQLDPKWKGIKQQEMFNLLYSKAFPISDQQKKVLVNRFTELIIFFAQMTLEAIIDEEFKKFQEKGKTKSLFKSSHKKEGFIATFSYLVATSGAFKKMTPLPENDWRKHFDLSKRTWKRRISELKKVDFPAIMSQEGFFVNFEDKDPLFRDVPK